MASRTLTSTTTATPSKKPPKIKQACDCCHARKIRCNGTSPCNNCQATSLPCTYLLIPKKKGPKGPSTRTPRAVLKMRMNQEQSAKSDTSLPDIQPAMSPPIVSPMKDNVLPDIIANRAFEPSPLLSMDVVERHLESFFNHKYRLFSLSTNSNKLLISQSRISNSRQGSTARFFDVLQYLPGSIRPRYFIVCSHCLASTTRSAIYVFCPLKRK